MTTRYQQQFPFGYGTAGTGAYLLNEQWQSGSGRNWALVPGVSPAMPGTQFYPSTYRKWDPADSWTDNQLAFVDVHRHALVLQALPPPPPPPMDFMCSGITRMVGSWSLESDEFYLQVMARIGTNAMQLREPSSGYAGMLISVTDLEGTTDAPFVLLGARFTGGLRPTISKWSDHTTIVDSFDGAESAASDFWLRALIEVDAEDGITIPMAEYSTGFGWRSLIDVGGEIILEGEHTSLCVGAAATSYNDGETAPAQSWLVGGMQVSMPIPESSQALFESRSLALGQGGRNWPGGA